jgi:hypothetical protein
MTRRSTDVSGDFRFRADRFFTEQGAWYCNTREGTFLGPYVDREAADSALSDYLHELELQEQDVWERRGVL